MQHRVPNDENPKPKVAVCVITYRRPAGLMRLLEGIARQTFKTSSPVIEVIVVDNDPDGTSLSICESAQAQTGLTIRHGIEPRRGIPFARNTAVTLVDDADLVAFIDDDEVPEVTWLAELIRVMEAYGADVTAGPVVPYFEESPPEWVLKGKFYDRRRWPTGERLDRAFTGNILFRRRVFDEMDVHFDERMVMTGGSDSHFLQRVHRAGFTIVWADDAVAAEWVPPSRVNAKWILQRAYRIGTTMAWVHRDFNPLTRSIRSLVIKGCFRVIKGILLLPLGLVWGKHKRVAYVRLICYGAGMLVGLFGGRYDEYRQTHGS